jgi:hypothetical protein
MRKVRLVTCMGDGVRARHVRNGGCGCQSVSTVRCEQISVVHVARMGRARRKDEVMVPLTALRQDMQRRLDRIVIDECHVILKMESSFGLKLGELGELARAETKVILLRATLRRCKEELLWKRMSWRADEVKMFRMSTAEENKPYSERGAVFHRNEMRFGAVGGARRMVMR